MSQDFKNMQGARPLTAVREEHTGWYGALVRHALYPEGPINVAPPRSFAEWLDAHKDDPIYSAESVTRLKKIHDDLHEAGVNFAAMPKEIALEAFDRFTVLFEEFLNRVTRLEQDALLENSGIDPLTGLRSRTVMIADLARELDRMARQGKPFSIAVAKIDDYESLVAQLRPEQMNTSLRRLAGLIQKSVRAFDDAYASTPGEFILCFKQAGVSGGFRALERLRKLLDDENIEAPLKAGPLPFSLSCCVGEPMPGDNLTDFLNELRRDMKDSVREPGTVLKYHELAPVRRLVKAGAD